MKITLEQETKTSSPKILLVEDNKLNQMVISEFLKQSGYRFDVADNGSTALKLAIEKTYRLILMDIGLPDISGIDVAIQIRQKGDTLKNVPIVALTAHGAEEVEEKCRQAGMNGFASKPISQEKLCSLVRQYIQGA